MQLKRKILVAVALFFIFSQLSFFTASAGEQEEHNTGTHEQKDEKFSPGKFIFDHIGDAHDWHILTVNDHHISIPLPILLYSEHTGFHAFWSNKLAHGHHYNGFYLDEEKGKIIEDIEGGVEYLPWDFSIKKNVFAIFISIGLLVWIFMGIGKKYKTNPQTAPSGLQSLLEPLILFIRDDLAKEAIGEKKYERFLPFLIDDILFYFY